MSEPGPQPNPPGNQPSRHAAAYYISTGQLDDLIDTAKELDSQFRVGKFIAALDSGQAADLPADLPAEHGTLKVRAAGPGHGTAARYQVWREQDTDIDGELRVLSVNTEFGGLDPDGATSRRGMTLQTIRDQQPDIVLLQEWTGVPPGSQANPSRDMPLNDYNQVTRADAARQHEDARRQLHDLASQLGMTAVLGAVIPGNSWPLYLAALVYPPAGIQVTASGPPPPAVPGAEAPPWCHITVQIDGIPYPVDLYSVHLPARTAAGQLYQAQRLASRTAERGALTHIAGDFNAIPRTQQPGEEELRRRPPHLRPARMHLDDGPLRPNYAVYDTLTGTGLADIAAQFLTPDELKPTGKWDLVDWNIASPEMAWAAIGYRQHENPGSDHDTTMTTYSRRLLAEAVPPGPAP